MAAAAMQASIAVCSSTFLSGSTSGRSRLHRSPSRTSSSSSKFKVEAKKGEWLPGLPSPAYLDGTLPGDNGFDPLGLANDPASLRWFVQAELNNGRWAMVGVAGMLIPEVLTRIGVWNAPTWYEAGKLEYFAPSSTLFVIEFLLFHYIEVRRYQDIKYPGSVNRDPIFKNFSLPPGEVGYPGGIFNPLNFPANEVNKEKELANGRLAMLAFLGFCVQNSYTHKSPVENLLTHISDPFHNTIIQTLANK